MSEDLFDKEKNDLSRYVIGNHDKSADPIYSIVPNKMGEILDDSPLIEGFAIGGSYASGKFKDGDDIDVDIFFESHLDPKNLIKTFRDVERRFKLIGLECQIRAPLARTAIPISMSAHTYDRHPNTPFVVRSEQVARAWGLMTDSNSNKES